jgi:hypothetical protein
MICAPGSGHFEYSFDAVPSTVAATPQNSCQVRAVTRWSGAVLFVVPRVRRKRRPALLPGPAARRVDTSSAGAASDPQSASRTDVINSVDRWGVKAPAASRLMIWR